MQEQTTDRIQQESEQVERLNKALKQEEERSALLTNELTELQASNTQCELHYGRERVAYESTIDTLTANVQQWQSTSNAKEQDTVQLKEKMNTMVAEMEELKTVANENKHLLLDKERKANALEKALQEMTQEKENVRQQTVHLTQDLEHQKTRILDCERSREEGNHELRCRYLSRWIWREIFEIWRRLTHCCFFSLPLFLSSSLPPFLSTTTTSHTRCPSFDQNKNYGH